MLPTRNGGRSWGCPLINSCKYKQRSHTAARYQHSATTTELIKMSESATAASQLQTTSRAIPTKRITVNDPSQLPHDYSTTPGGTLFSTTPGGTRIIYDRAFLMQCRNSPLAKSPPNMTKIPGVTSPGSVKDNGHIDQITENRSAENAEEPQFEMDI